MRELETARQAIRVASRETEAARLATELAGGALAHEQPRNEPSTPPGSGERDTGPGWSIERRSKLVKQFGGEHPDRLAEWEAYLFFLGDYASGDEPLPPIFDALVADVFEPLLDGANE